MAVLRVDPQDTDDLVEVAREAYVVFLPMLMGYRYLFGSFLAPGLPSHMVPVSTLGGQPRTLGPSFRDVITPNAGTPYSMAGLDLRAHHDRLRPTATVGVPGYRAGRLGGVRLAGVG